MLQVCLSPCRSFLSKESKSGKRAPKFKTWKWGTSLVAVEARVGVKAQSTCMLPCPPHHPHGDSLHLSQPWFLWHSVDWPWTLRPLEPRVIQNTLFLILPKFYTAFLQRNTELLLLPSGIVFMESRFNVLSSSFAHSWKKKTFHVYLSFHLYL